MKKQTHSIHMNSEASKVKIDFQKGRLRRSLTIISCLIEKGNEDLWPIFDKLEDELVRLEKRQSRLSRYSKH